MIVFFQIALLVNGQIMARAVQLVVTVSAPGRVSCSEAARAVAFLARSLTRVSHVIYDLAVSASAFFVILGLVCIQCHKPAVQNNSLWRST